jgi:hypothetical protein
MSSLLSFPFLAFLQLSLFKFFPYFAFRNIKTCVIISKLYICKFLATNYPGLINTLS